MKLIRVSSDDDSALFETQFNQSINVKPMSKIALCDFSGTLKPIQHKAFSNELNYAIEWGNGTNETLIGRANIKNGIYNRNNYWNLVDEITNGFNETMNFQNTNNDNNLLGGQWKAYVEDKRININYQIGFNQFRIRDFQKPSTIVALSSTNVIGMLSGLSSTPEYHNIITAKYNASMGIGYIRGQIHTLKEDTNAGNGLTQQGFLMGFSKTILPDYNPTEFVENDIDFGIGVGYNGSSWEFYTQQGSIITGLGVTPDYTGVNGPDNSFIEVIVNSGKVQCFYTHNNTRTILCEYAHNINDKLYGFYCFHSNKVYVQLKYCEWTFDPFNNPTTKHDRFPSNPNILYTNPNDFSIKELVFNNQSLINFLGFDINLFQTGGIGYKKSPLAKGGYNFIGELLFYPSVSKRNFILELLSNNVESFDSIQKQRKNIISSGLISNENDIIEKESNILYIDLNNKDEIDLRNIKMRVVDTNYQPIELIGISVATLLIADENERSF